MRELQEGRGHVAWVQSNVLVLLCEGRSKLRPLKPAGGFGCKNPGGGGRGAGGLEAGALAVSVEKPLGVG